MSAAFKSSTLIALLVLTGCASPHLAAFERTLAAQDSATAALTKWCSAQKIANPARITANSVHGADSARPLGLAALLGVNERESLGYRHVRLTCGDTVLSEAHNWYVPTQLSPQMNVMLATTDTPFGTVAAPLHFKRERISARRGRDSACPAGTVLSHRALLRLPSGDELALVIECYTPANLRGDISKQPLSQQ